MGLWLGKTDLMIHVPVDRGQWRHRPRMIKLFEICVGHFIIFCLLCCRRPHAHSLWVWLSGIQANNDECLVWLLLAFLGRYQSSPHRPPKHISAFLSRLIRGSLSVSLGKIIYSRDHKFLRSNQEMNTPKFITSLFFHKLRYEFEFSVCSVLSICHSVLHLMAFVGRGPQRRRDDTSLTYTKYYAPLSDDDIDKLKPIWRGQHCALNVNKQLQGEEKTGSE